jgi:uncharacterized RDD family membrane protein YckC
MASPYPSSTPGSPEPAPLLRRTPAFLLDQAVVLLLVVPPALAVGVPFGDVVSPGQTRRAVFLVLMAVAFVYHFLFEWLTGLTLGKRALGLRVVADDGGTLGVRGSFFRNALRLIDGLLYWGVAVAVILVRGDGKRIGDVAGRTLVVRGR